MPGKTEAFQCALEYHSDEEENLSVLFSQIKNLPRAIRRMYLNKKRGLALSTVETTLWLKTGQLKLVSQIQRSHSSSRINTVFPRPDLQTHLINKYRMLFAHIWIQIIVTMTQINGHCGNFVDFITDCSFLVTGTRFTTCPFTFSDCPCC